MQGYYRVMAFKIPESVLVVIHTAQLDVLLLERAGTAGLWQSVTGSREPGDADLAATARRELLEETGLSEGVLSDWRLTQALRDLGAVARPLCARRHA